MQTTSWVIREKSTKTVVLETFNQSIVDVLNAAKYEAMPILAYLQEFNRSVKHSSTNQLAEGKR